MAQQELGGPYLTAAVFCEKVLKEADGVSSLIRIVDRIIMTASGPNPPEKMPPVTITTNLFLSFKSGFAKGSHTVKIVVEGPSGPAGSEALLPVLFEGDDRGVNHILNVNLQVQDEGIYWFEVYLGDRLLTKTPLRVVYQRLRLAGGPAGKT